MANLSDILNFVVCKEKQTTNKSNFMDNWELQFDEAFTTLEHVTFNLQCIPDFNLVLRKLTLPTVFYTVK